MSFCASPIDKPLLTNPMLLFVNPASGGGLGLELMGILADVKNLYIVQLPAEQDTWHLKYSKIANDKNLRAVVAGGDGSVSWVVKLLSNYYDEDSRPPLAVIPFGTGNDMSRNLGWGYGMSKSALQMVGRTIENMASTDHIEKIDVWSVAVQDKRSEEVQTHQMINYISLGAEGNVVISYETIRRSVQPFLCCQCMSKAMFVPAGLIHFCGKRSLNEYTNIELINFDGYDSHPQKLKTLNGEKTLLVLSCKTIYAGKDIWRGSEIPDMSDGKLEVLGQGGVCGITLTQIGINATRTIGQANAIRMETSEPIAFQIDGEGYCVNGPSVFDIVKTGNYPMLFSQ